jgi:hypothetical protein
MTKKYYPRDGYGFSEQGDAVLAKTDEELIVWGQTHLGLEWHAADSCFVRGTMRAVCELHEDGSPKLSGFLRARLREWYCDSLD